MGVSGHLAYDCGVCTTVLKADREEPHEEKAKYVTVYRRQQAGDWEIVIDSYCGNA